VRLSVEDTGVGMDAETRSRAFEAAFTTHRESGGKGLGLRMVRSIAERASGSVSIESELGVGTKVRVDLPLVEERARVSEPPPSRELPALGLEALVVEDDPLSQQIVAGYLEQMTTEVACAKSGEAALSFLAENPGRTNLIITDIVLPGMSGPDLVTRALERDPEMLVVLVSAHDRKTLLERRLISERTPVLRKPFTPDGLADAIRSASCIAETNRPPRYAR
jgi:CheY-like chemotaxis protein